MTIKSGRPDIDFRPNLAKTRYFPTVMTSQWPKKLFFCKNAKIYHFGTSSGSFRAKFEFLLFLRMWRHKTPLMTPFTAFYALMTPGVGFPTCQGSTPYRSPFCPRGGERGLRWPIAYKFNSLLSESYVTYRVGKQCSRCVLSKHYYSSRRYSIGPAYMRCFIEPRCCWLVGRMFTLNKSIVKSCNTSAQVS